MFAGRLRALTDARRAGGIKAGFVRVPLDHPHSRTPVGVDPQTIPRPFFALDGRGEN
jgi:hypothetical protein